MKSTAYAVFMIMLAVAMVQAGKSKRPKFCLGKNNIKYEKNEGYTEGCTQFICVKKGKKFKMMSKQVPKCEDGIWSAWSSYSACSASCGPATKSRTRTCSNPAPANGGKPCPGLNQQTMDCQLSPCRGSEPDLSANVTAIEASMQFLNESMESIESKFEALQSSVESILGMMTTMQSTSKSLETNISSNMEAINTNKKSITKNEGFISVNKDTISTNNAALAAKDAQMEMNITSTMEAINTNKQSISTNNAALAAKDTQMEVNITSIMDDIKTNREAISTNEDDISKNNDGISSNKNTCSAIQVTATKLETCLGDVNSMDCPSSEDGKISMADAIKKNKEDVAELNKMNNLVLILGADPWITVNLEDFSLISSNLSVPDPGMDYTFQQKGGYTVGKVINGKMYLCETYKKFCISYNGTGLEWKLENEMKPLISRHGSADTLIPGDQPKWIVQGAIAHCAHCFRRDIDVWTAQSGKWKTENYSPPFPNDIGCIAVIEGKILQVGGRINPESNKVVYSNRVFLGDVEMASMKATRIYHHCTMFENRVWVAGGVAGDWGIHSHTVEIYDYKTDSWTYGPSLPFKPRETDSGKLKVIRGDLYFICRDCGKIFKLINNGDIYTWKAMADIPKNSGRIAEVMEIKH